MTVVSEGPLCLKIHLNRFELKKYFTSYDKIIFADPKVKKTIECLFDTAISTLPFETNGKRIIEVYPTASGGCILKFTTEPLDALLCEQKENHNIRLKNHSQKTSNYIFAFADFEALLRAMDTVCNRTRAQTYFSNVYHTKGRYYLHIVIPLFDRKTAIRLNEFADFSARGAVALGLLQEHAIPIAETNAVLTLCEAFLA